MSNRRRMWASVVAILAAGVLMGQGAPETSPSNSEQDRIVQELKELLLTDQPLHKKKMTALARLGAIGSKSAIDAIAEFEQWAQARPREPKIFYFGVHESPITHMSGQDLQPAAEIADAKGETWAVFWWYRENQCGLYLTQQLDKKTKAWSPPRLLEGIVIGLPIRDEDRKVALELQDDQIVVKHAQTHTYPLKTYRQTAASNPARSTAPTSQPKSIVPDDDESQIRQAAFTYFFATSNGREPLYLITPHEGDRSEVQATSASAPATKPADFTQQKYIGYAGRVEVRAETVQGENNVTAITIKERTATTAKVYVGDYVGNSAASGSEVFLKKLHGRWVVVRGGMMWIS